MGSACIFDAGAAVSAQIPVLFTISGNCVVNRISSFSFPASSAASHSSTNVPSNSHSRPSFTSNSGSFSLASFGETARDFTAYAGSRGVPMYNSIPSAE